MPGQSMTSNAVRCPHCEYKLVAHPAEIVVTVYDHQGKPVRDEVRAAAKEQIGAWHCNRCGCCFTDPVEGELRPGHTACALLLAPRRWQ